MLATLIAFVLYVVVIVIPRCGIDLLCRIEREHARRLWREQHDEEIAQMRAQIDEVLQSDRWRAGG